ncbi:MAG: isoprenylcysteine carboxylmethyltransferase family protein [Anaerolineales bacterium]|nr:isoprenylcysteine carboxylmethyltransferase family protein [Anaerolineales bacterium]
MARIAILIISIALAILMLSFNAIQKLAGNQRLGRLPMHPLWFAAGKLAMGISWGFLFAQALGVGVIPFSVPAALEYVSAAMLLAAVPLLFFSYLHLGADSRFGLSEESNILYTTGIFRVSRNPMYLGFYLITLASWMAVPHTLNIACGLAGIYVHHRIVLAEERFLSEKHGAPFDAYRQKVGRYLILNKERKGKSA